MSSNSNNKQRCLFGYTTTTSGAHLAGGGSTARTYSVKVKDSKTKATRTYPIKCEVCNNKCFYAHTMWVRTHHNAGNSKESASIKAMLKVFIPKTGRLIKSLSCTNCGNFKYFRNYDIVQGTKAS